MTTTMFNISIPLGVLKYNCINHEDTIYINTSQYKLSTIFTSFVAPPSARAQYIVSQFWCKKLKANIFRQFCKNGAIIMCFAALVFSCLAIVS